MLRIIFKPVGGISSPYKIFIDNVFFGKMKPGETKKIDLEEGVHFISFQIIKKWNIFSYKYKFNVNNMNDIYFELRPLNWLNAILIFCGVMSGDWFPEIPGIVRCITIFFVIYIANYLCRPLIFKKYNLQKRRG
jgi:hypothetical protein